MFPEKLIPYSPGVLYSLVGFSSVLIFPSPKFQFTWELPGAVPLKLIVALPFTSGKLPVFGENPMVKLEVEGITFVLTADLPQAEAYSICQL